MNTHEIPVYLSGYTSPSSPALLACGRIQVHLDLLYPSLYNCKFILKLCTQWDNVVPTSSLWTVKM